MAELSGMPHLDENKNTSTLSNYVLESDDSVHTSTNNGVKNITSEYAYQSPSSVKGNFSEINSNITVLSPKNLNILTAETEGGFVKSDIGSAQDNSNISILGDAENSFKTANGSILGETNASFRSLNESYLEEIAKSSNSAVKSILDDTIKSPTLSLRAGISLQGTEGLKNSGEISFNDTSSPTIKSYTESFPNSPFTTLLNDTSTVTSLMGNNPSSPENKFNSSGKSHLNITSTVELPSENQIPTEDKLDTLTKTVIGSTSFSSSQTSYTEDKPETSLKIPLNNTAKLELLSDNQISFIEEKPDASVKISSNTTSLVESPSGNRISCTEDKLDASGKCFSGTSELELPAVKQTSFIEDERSSSSKSNLGTPGLESPAVKQTSFKEDKSDTSSKSILGSFGLESPAAKQTSFTEEKPNTSSKSILGTSGLESPAAKQTSFTEEKPDTLSKSILGTSGLESPAVKQTSFTEEKPDTSSKSILGTSGLESPATRQTSFTEDKPSISSKSILGTSKLESPAVKQTSFTEDKLDTSGQSILGTPKFESPVVKQTSCSENTPVKSLLEVSSTASPFNNDPGLTIDKLNTPVKGLLEVSSTASSFNNDPGLTIDKLNSPVKGLLEVSSTALPFNNDPGLTIDKLSTPVENLLKSTSSDLAFDNNVACNEQRPATSVETSLNTTSKEVLSLPTCDSSSNANKQDTECNPEVDVSFKKASSLPNKSAFFTVDNALINSSLVSNQEMKTNSSNNLNCGALDQASIGSSALDQAPVGSCASNDNSDFVNCSQPIETTPKKNAGFRDSSRLIEFSMIEDGSAAEQSAFKVPSIKLDSNTPDQDCKDSQNASQLFSQPKETIKNVSFEAFDGGLHDEKISALAEDPFGMHKSEPFDLIGMNASPGEDFVFKVPEIPANVENEEFTDAVQFFKDPSSFQFLESIKTSQTAATEPRSSLYIKFDPLHSTFNSHGSDILQALKNEANLDPDKQLNLSARESLGNILISFDSPRLADCRDAQTPVMTAPVKVYTEEELQQHLKVNELTNQEMLLKKQREMEEELVRKEKEMLERAEEKDARINQVESLLKVHNKCLEEFALISSAMLEKNKTVLQEMESIKEENAKLKGDVKTLTDDLQSVETTFADFHKRYEQCKSMLKTYKDNEELLRTKLKEQEQTYQVLQDRTQESSEKASSEISSVKKASEAQIAVLNAQLKKANLKISSLESDIKQIRIENSQLGGICDDLMEKVGKS